MTNRDTREPMKTLVGLLRRPRGDGTQRVNSMAQERGRPARKKSGPEGDPSHRRAPGMVG
jgi:hypothetical protein